MIDITLVIGLSLAVLAFCLFCILIISVPIALQLYRTLNSAQYLIDTVNDDIQPAVKEIKQSVNELKNVVRKCTSPIRTVFDKVSVPLISSAYGVLTAVKSYLTNCTDDKSDFSGK